VTCAHDGHIVLLVFSEVYTPQEQRRETAMQMLGGRGAHGMRGAAKGLTQKGMVGIKNQGTTCFVNCFLQVEGTRVHAYCVLRSLHMYTLHACIHINVQKKRRGLFAMSVLQPK
jgi:hypothetical protein